MSEPTNPGRRRPRRAAPTDAFTLQYDTTRIKEPHPPAPRPSATDSFSERYAVGAALGVGGMAEVTLCLDRRIGREVALKVPLPPRREVDVARARFLREARIHPLKDDKVLTDWNGLMIAAIAKASRSLRRLAATHAATPAIGTSVATSSTRPRRLPEPNHSWTRSSWRRPR